MLITLTLSLRIYPKIKQGDKFIVLEDVKVDVLTYFNAPYTDGFSCVIPKGTILISLSAKISGFSCAPENKEDFEKLYVPVDQRSDKYAGYSIILNYKEIGKRIKKLNI